MDQTEQHTKSNVALLSERIATLEGRFAGSWACQTRDEYEKALRVDIKQEILGYVTRIAIGLLLFLGGAGALFIKLTIDEIYQSENAKVIQNLQARYDMQVKDDRIRAEWERFHNYGTTYRYLAELYSKSNLSSEAKQKSLSHIFDNAKTYYEVALRNDPRQSSTHFELGQLYHTYAISFDVPTWRKNQEAIDEYQQSIELATQDDIAKGWRAEALTMLGELEIDEYTSNPRASTKNKELLDKAYAHLRQARTEYERAIPEEEVYNQLYVTQNNTLMKKVVSLKLLTNK